jgi:hypothetical protein
MIGAEREKKTGIRILPAQDFYKARYALQGAAPGIHVNFQGKLHRNSGAHACVPRPKRITFEAIDAGDLDLFHGRDGAGFVNSIDLMAG